MEGKESQNVHSINTDHSKLININFLKYMVGTTPHVSTFYLPDIIVCAGSSLPYFDTRNIGGGEGIAKTYSPNIWRVSPPTLFLGSLLLAVPLKHSTRIPFSSEVAVPSSVDVKEVAFVSKPVPGLAVKALLGPQIEEDDDLCCRGHSLLLLTLQVVSPIMSPVTVHLKVKVSPGQVGRAVMNCPATSPGEISSLT